MVAKIRTIKPEFFLHDELFEAERETGLPLRLAYIGLWTQCDREGRFAWKPRQLGIQILPYDGINFSGVLDALAERGFLMKYASQGEDFGCVPSFSRHQYINNREAESKIPPPPGETVPAHRALGLEIHNPRPGDELLESESPDGDSDPTGEPLVPHASEVCTSGTGSGIGTGSGNSPLPPTGRTAGSPDGRKSCQTTDSDSEALIVAWNAIPGVPQVSKLTDKRRRILRARLADPHFRENWQTALQIVARSEFCRGLVTPPDGRKEPWRADFDWFLRPDVLVRLIEGKYGGLPAPPGSQPLAGLSPVPLTNGRPAAPLPPLTAEEAIDPAAFDAWFVQQDTFDRDDSIRHDLHAVRCSVSRILGHKPDVARDQLQVRLSRLAAGRPLSERPRRDDEFQAARELQELQNNRAADVRRPANESQQPTLIGGVA